LKGKKCWDIGCWLGSIINISFGEKLTYIPPSFGPKDSGIILTGEFHLKVIDFWQIFQNQEPYCNFRYVDEDSYTELCHKIRILENKTVIDVSIDKDTFNIQIEFEEDLVFEVLADIGDEYYNKYNYTKDDEVYVYYTMEKIYCLNPFGKIFMEKFKNTDRMLYSEYIKKEEYSLIKQNLN
jgi:hypothetical protein